MHKNNNNTSTSTLLLIFLFSTNLAFGISNLIIFGKFWMDGKAHPSLFIAFNIAAILAYWVTKQYTINVRTQIAQLVFKQFEFFFVFIFLVMVYWFSVNSIHYKKEAIVLFFLLAFAINFILNKLYINFLRKTLKASPHIPLLIGNSPMTERVQNELLGNKWLGFNVVTEINNYPKDFSKLKEIVMDNNIQSIFVDLDSVNQTGEREEQLRSLSECENIKCYAFSSVLGKNLMRGSYILIGTIQAVPMFVYPLDSLRNKLLKRGFDILFTILIFFTIFIWLFPLLMLLIAIDSGFPIFFKQKRHGMDNKVFNCYKFRTMYLNKHSDTKTTVKGDPRITRLGRILRKTSIDELPQFWNILLGDMSVVGPRPHMVSQNNHYKELIDKYILRHFVRPGLTGLAQVKGYRGEINNNKDMENRVKEDIFYIRNWSFFLDLKIILLTFINTVKGDKNAI